MRKTLVRIGGVTLCWLACAAMLPAGQIEAVKGKQYKLTKQHGPWMIMVGSFRDVSESDRKTKGLSAQEAADEVVYELRKKGIPAYTFSQDAEKGEIKTVDRSGREDLRIFAAQRDMICVIAGNYATQDDATGERTLKFVKKFKPEFMKQKESGAIYRQSDKKGPFGVAFMTINPLLDPTEVAQKKPDYDVIKMNHGIDNALIENKAKYTVQVATFTGRSITPVGNSSMVNREREFDQRLQAGRDPSTGMMRSNLNDAGEDAAQLANELRHMKTPQIPNGLDAWVYHDRYESIVTVGSFDNPNDPRIAKIVENFGAKKTTDKTTGQDVIVAEVLKPTATRNARTPSRMWVFDPQPRVIEVPQLKTTAQAKAAKRTAMR